MKRTILNHEAFCAVIEDKRLVEYIRKDASDQSGSILLGKIERMMPGLHCAFVDIGRKKSGFLPLTEAGDSFTGKTVRSGDIDIVQIRKEEKGEKGVFLTRDITIAGRNIILMPMNRYIGVSNRIEDEDIREALKKLGNSIADGRFGLVMRHGAAGCDPETISAEAEQCYQKWIAILQKAEESRSPGTKLYHGAILEQLIDDYFPIEPDEIVKIEQLDSEYSKQLSQAADRIVNLPNGGNVVIDYCEAMTVIDVNTASSNTAPEKEQTVLETNIEACAAITEQIRLRNLSGIIVIDFIDMENEEDRKCIYSRLEQCLKRDRVKTVIHGWTSLGLMEITRKRTRPSIYENLFSICASCKGRGIVLKENNR